MSILGLGLNRGRMFDDDRFGPGKTDIISRELDINQRFRYDGDSPPHINSEVIQGNGRRGRILSNDHIFDDGLDTLRDHDLL